MQELVLAALLGNGVEVRIAVVAVHAAVAGHKNDAIFQGKARAQIQLAHGNQLPQRLGGQFIAVQAVLIVGNALELLPDKHQVSVGILDGGYVEPGRRHGIQLAGLGVVEIEPLALLAHKAAAVGPEGQLGDDFIGRGLAVLAFRTGGGVVLGGEDGVFVLAKLDQPRAL